MPFFQEEKSSSGFLDIVVDDVVEGKMYTALRISSPRFLRCAVFISCINCATRARHAPAILQYNFAYSPEQAVVT